MWVLPFVVGVGIHKVRGLTWGAAAFWSGSSTWIINQLAKGRLMTVGRAVHTAMQLSAYNLVGGVALGLGVGYMTSYALFGKEGAQDFVDLYTGRVPIVSLASDSYLGVIAAGPMNAYTKTQGNRAVPGNAAGIPAGTNITTMNPTPQEIYQQEFAEFAAKKYALNIRQY